MDNLLAPDTTTLRSWAHHFAPIYPVKRRFKEDSTLAPGALVAH